MPVSLWSAAPSSCNVSSSRLAARRIFCQSGQQIAAPVGGQRVAERPLLLRGQAQFIRIDNRRIIQTPLKNVIGLEHGGAFRRLIRFGKAAFAAAQTQRAKLVGHFDLSIEHHQRRRFVVGDLEIELGASDDCHVGLGMVLPCGVGGQ